MDDKKKNTASNRLSRRRRSFSDFSDHYTDTIFDDSNYISTEKKRPGLKAFKIIIGTVLLVFVAVVGYLATDVLLNISEDTFIIDREEKLKQSRDSGGSTAIMSLDDDINAAFADISALDSGNSLDSAIMNAEINNLNSICITFKDSDGKLYYKTALSEARNMAAGKSARSNAPGSIEKLHLSSLMVIANVYCFEDNLAADARREWAVRRSGSSSSLFKSGGTDSDTQAFLSPYSDEAIKYNCDIIKEISALGTDYILLNGVRYPDTLDGAKLSDDSSKLEQTTKNNALLNFLDKAKISAGKTQLIVNVLSKECFKDDNSVYYGSLFESAADAVAIDLRFDALPETILVNDTQTQRGDEATAEYLKEVVTQIEKKDSTQEFIYIIDSPELAEDIGVKYYITM